MTDAFRNQRTPFPVAPKPPKPAKPKAPRVTAPKPAVVAPVTPTSTAMDAFRTALAQLNTATPPVDAAAIRAPYAASEAITGQLGQGFQQATDAAGQQAQQQYATARDAAQQHAAQFGISAGAGANPTALADNGTAALAQQSAAYSAAAPAATAQWQALLERTAGAKVGEAQVARDTGLTSARQSLATSLPGAIQNEKQLGFQEQTQRDNMGLARSQLTAKQINDLQQYELGAAKVNQSARTAATSASIKRASLTEKTANDAAKLRVSQDTLALKRRSQQATAQGLKGIAAATKALGGSTSKAGTKKVAKGWDVQVVALDPDTGEPTGNAQTMQVPDKRKAPKGFQIVKGSSASTHYESVPTSAGSAGLTASQWDVQMRSLLAQNPGRSAEVKKFLGPRPKKELATKKPPLALPVVPPRGSPFLGISGTNAPAHVTAIPHLTAQVAIAKARKERLQQGGLLTASQRAEEQKAAKTLAKPEPAQKRPPVSPPKTSARTPQGVPATLPLPNSAPFRVPLPSAPASASPPRVPSGRRGAQPAIGARGGLRTNPQLAPESHPNILGALTGPLLGKTGAAAVAHAIDLGAGTTIAALGPSALSDVKHPIAAAQAIKKRGLVTTEQASNDLAARVAHVGSHVAIPKGLRIPSIDLVAPAGAAVPKGAITPDELKQLEAQGYDLKPRLLKRFTDMALKNGYTAAELDGLSGSARIDKAFSKPASEPLRVLGNFAGGVAKLGTLPAGVEGAVRETAAGHGADVAKALGQGLYSELPVVGKHPFLQTLEADPFGTITQFAGAGKTVGEVGRLGKLDRGVRSVESAASGLKVNRGNLSRNAYTATGQLASDKLASTIPHFGGKLEAKQVDTLVRSAVNKHAPEYVAVQRPYKAALDKVGNKRAAELQAYQQAGGKPEQIAAFYRAQGEAAPAKFYDRVAKTTKTLTAEDQTFLDTHAALTHKTSQALQDSGKFSDTASTFRRYSPLIRSSAHLGDPEAQRILALRDEYLKGFDVMPPEDAQALRGAIDQGVQDYAQKHLASGGVEPAYVAYGKPKPLIASPFTPSAGGTIGFKTPKGRQKAETGATFESGKFLIDPTSPLAENVRAQRQHLSSVLHEDVSKAVGTHLTAGDPIPAGHVFVSETNLRGLRRTTNDLADNPVSAPDYYAEEAGVRQKLFDHLSANTQPSGQRVPRGEKGYAIPEAAWKRILDHTRPPSRGAYMKFMRQYQRVLVSYRPSTIVNNTVGSLPLAMTGGAGPKSFAMAARAMHDPTLAPAVLRSHGVAGSFAPSVRSHVGAGLDFMRAQSAKGEDFSRLATFFSKAGPTIKKRAKELNQTTDEYARAFAAGKVDEPLLNAALDHTEKFIGDMLKPDGPLARKAGGVILFHSWVGHIAKLLLKTLPVDHPRRLNLLLTLSAYGDQYRQEHGVWPDWYREYLPLFQHVERIGRTGRPQTFTKTFSTAGVNPFSTINNLANPVSTNDSIKNLLTGIASPPIQIGFNTIANRPYDSKSPWAYLAGQTVRQIPGVSVIRPQGGMASDSIPFIAEQRKVYSSGRKVNGKTVPLPYDFRPTARAEPGILGALIRYGLGGVYDVPAQGPIHNIDQKKHIGADVKAARKH